LSRVEYGESDLIVQVFTESLGRLSALARGARKSQRRFSSLEPFHTLKLTFSDRRESELVSLREAGLERARFGLVGDLESLDAAARGLRWLRRATGPRSPEPRLFQLAERLLDQIGEAPALASSLLGAYGLDLLSELGWGLDFSACISCGKPCLPGQAAFVHPARGGLICRACGGGPLRISAGLRDFLSSDTPGRGAHDLLTKKDAEAILELVERALTSHMGIGER
jgi:DNA repair protein RecO (recombination protein O)